jgi:hypothetical protein
LAGFFAEAWLIKGLSESTSKLHKPIEVSNSGGSAWT